MKLSIITVNLNNRDGLQKTIDSVIRQTFRDFEWIIIDGGSTDGSKELIEKYADHFAYWVSEPDKGIYNAMNKGIKVAKGEYLQFLNSGDLLYGKETLENIFCNSKGSDIIYGDCEVVYNNCNKQTITYSDNLLFSFLLDYTICHQCAFIKKELLNAEPYDEKLKLVSDWKFFLRKSIEGYIFEHQSHTIAIIDGGGLSHTQGSILLAEREQVINKEVPISIINDYLLLRKLQKENSEKQIIEFKQYRKKYSLYHKILTAALSLIKTIDKLRNIQKNNIFP